jgi:LPS-assembly lipoprotein
MRIKMLRQLTLFLVGIILVACGFHLRGLADLSFDKLYIKGNSSISSRLISTLKTNGVKVVKSPEDSQVQLEIVKEGTEKRILSLGGTGTIREYELFYRISLRVKDSADELWGAEQMIEKRCDFTYLDSQALAKSYEEQQLYEDMRNDATMEILRRLVKQKPKVKVTQ